MNENLVIILNATKTSFLEPHFWSLEISDNILNQCQISNNGPSGSLRDDVPSILYPMESFPWGIF
uniref:Uncharacterized protein n=1 Tax=Romanomermis culicivorax TaxID=13658 RepID=A0A915J529_ROMCU